ncbi:MAG: SUF system Fe-S cluster assembly regulator [Candidatus Eisenbacteria bacterium]
MFRITKLTDYGVALLAVFAGKQGGEPRTARDVASQVGLPLPTVSKILKALSRAGILVSHRGARGGYGLARPSEEISIAEIIRALEGPIAFTECVAAGPGACAQETLCGMRASWRLISETVSGALEKIMLSEMAGPAPDFERWLEEAIPRGSAPVKGSKRTGDEAAFPKRESSRRGGSPALPIPKRTTTERLK